MKSNLPAELLQAYLETDYFVSDDPPLMLRIGEENDDAKILLASFGVTTSALITAWNPGSEVLSEDENDSRQAALLGEIESKRLNYLVGYGERQDWLEYSYLVLGITRDEANELAEQFGQNAYVWIDQQGVPELITLA
ncbi:MAG: DUF3293 domain-containing protein [Pseudomonadales bacterium]|nr:DUF3293 domain-containing protein [Pseudomonadales bacterium]MBO6564086.1 DUF3293 domain-containing protein [Pseudomonadales bacterium]MBO6596429.1 DUF3293 domain-containing protein [Pseudomonadales bacterium]MBO6822909.1 DUF3293 domain-containing protein [Pseudomonadales bacterium]